MRRPIAVAVLVAALAVPTVAQAAPGLRNDVRGPQTGLKPIAPVKTRAKVRTSNHAPGQLICTNSYFGDIQALFGTACIPKQGDGWAKYQSAAVWFWNQQPPPSPRTTKWGNNGAVGYGIPTWCRDAWNPYNYWYPHGVKTAAFDAAYPFAYVLIEGQPTAPAGEHLDQYCTIFMRRDIYEAAPNRSKCLTYIHEFGHLLGWSHDNYPSPNGWIMNPSLFEPSFNEAPLQAKQACAAYVV